MNGRYLVLCHMGDRSAVRVYCALRNRLGSQAVHILSDEELALAPRWSHLLATGSVSTDLTLPGGRRLPLDRMALLFQRLRYLNPPQFQAAKADDRDYAATEMQALLLSWLVALPCPVVNRAGHRGLCGADRSLVEWMTLAASVGWPVRGLELVSEARRFDRPPFLPHSAVDGRETEDPPRARGPQVLGRAPVQYLEAVESPPRRVLVVGRRCFGLPDGLREEICIELARASGDHILGVTLGLVQGEWRFCSATPMPEIPPEAAQFVADALIELEEAA